MPSSPSQLNEYSQQFADELFPAFPVLVQHARVSDPAVEPGALLIEFPTVPGRPDCVFSVSTFNHEVTIGFDRYHQHFAWPEEDPCQFIHDLMAESLLIEVRMRGGGWVGSTTLRRNERPDLRNLGPIDRIYIRSWTGALDQELHGAEGTG